MRSICQAPSNFAPPAWSSYCSVRLWTAHVFLQKVRKQNNGTILKKSGKAGEAQKNSKGCHAGEGIWRGDVNEDKLCCAFKTLYRCGGAKP